MIWLTSVAAVPASFTVSPTQVFLNPVTTSALLTLRNESGDPLRFQLTAFKWAQSPTGEMLLTPTTDIVFFPALVALTPHEERKIRVGATAAFGSVEQTYRIFVEELPAPTVAGAPTNGVQMRTRMGVPIFMQPAKATSGGALSDPVVTKGKVTVQVSNRGSIHFVAESVRLIGKGPTGTEVFNKMLNGWYVLAGQGQTFDFPLTDAECRAATTMLAEASTGQALAVMHSQVTVDPSRCSAPR